MHLLFARPASHLVMSVIVSIVIPVLGIPAVILALKSKKSLENQRIEDARKYANYSLLLSLVGIFLVGALVVIGYSLALSEYTPDVNDVTASSAEDTRLESPNSSHMNEHEHKLPYQHYRGSIYDINYDTFNRYL